MIFSFNELKTARDRGYSDDEIWNILSSKDKEIGLAKQRGYSLEEVASITSGQPIPQQQQVVEEVPEPSGVLRQAADIPIKFAQGIVGSVRSMTDLFGANNPVSKSLAGYEDYFDQLMSAESKQDAKEVSRLLKEAEDKGIYDKVIAGLNAFAKAPLEMTAQSAGYMVPQLAVGVLGRAAMLTKAGAVAGFAQNVGIAGKVASLTEKGKKAQMGLTLGTGFAQGAGNAKGELYQNTKEYLREQGVPEDKIEPLAVKAQAYNGENLDNIIGQAGLNAIAASTGAEAILTRVLSKQGKEVSGEVVAKILKGVGVNERTAKSIAPVIAGGVKGIAEEAPLEGIQSGYEKVTTNIGEQRAGLNTPTFQGAIESATTGLVAGGFVGGLAGGVEALSPEQKEQRDIDKEAERRARELEAGNTAAQAISTELTRLERGIDNKRQDLDALESTSPEASNMRLDIAADQKKLAALKEQANKLGLSETITEAEKQQIELARAITAPEVSALVEPATPTKPTPVAQESAKGMNLQEVSESAIAAFPDMMEAEGGLLPLTRFTPDEQASLRNAGIVETATTSTGETYEGVNAEYLWQRRKQLQDERAKKVQESTAPVAEVAPPTEPTIKESLPVAQEAPAITPTTVAETPVVTETTTAEVIGKPKIGEREKADTDFASVDEITEIFHKSFPAGTEKSEVKKIAVNFVKDYINQSIDWVRDTFGSAPDKVGFDATEMKKWLKDAISVRRVSDDEFTKGIIQKKGSLKQNGEVNISILSPLESRLIALHESSHFLYHLGDTKSIPENVLNSIKNKKLMPDRFPNPRKDIKEKFADAFTNWSFTKMHPEYANEFPSLPKEFVSWIESEAISEPLDYISSVNKIRNQKLVKSAPAIETPAVTEAPAAEPAGISVGNRIKLGKSPQTYIIEEVVPQSEVEKVNNEQFYSVKNERTGEVQVVEAKDLKKVVGKGSRKMAAERERITPRTPEEIDAFNKASSNKVMARNPELAVAAVRLNNGEITAGEYADLIDALDPFTTKGAEFIPTKAKIDQYIDEGKKDKVNAPIENGKEVEFRIDIPTYNRSTAAGDTVYAVTAHEPVPETSKRVGTPISYVGVAKVINPKMMTRSISGKGEAIDIATGSGKFPLATVKGNYEAITELPADINDPNAWTEVSYNPIRSSYFVDVRSKNAIVGGDEAIMVGSRVFVKNPQMETRPQGFLGEDKRYMAGGLENQEVVTPTPEENRYTFEQVVRAADKYFGKMIPEGFVIVTDTTSKDLEYKAGYNLGTNQIILNLAYINNNESIDDLISHELGHYIFGDPKFQEIFKEFWNLMSPEEKAAFDKIINQFYNKETGAVKMEEKQVRAFMQLIAESKAQPAWRKLLDKIKRWINEKLKTNFEVTDRGAAAVLAAAYKRFKSGEKIVREIDSGVLKMAAERQRIMGEKIGPLKKTPEGIIAETQAKLRERFDPTKVTEQNTTEAFRALGRLTGKEGTAFAQELNDIGRMVDESGAAAEVSMGAALFVNDLFEYAVRLAAEGQKMMLGIMMTNINRLPTGTEGRSDAGRALRAAREMKDTFLTMARAEQDAFINYAAEFVYGPNPTKEQVDSIKIGYDAVEKVQEPTAKEVEEEIAAVGEKTGTDLVGRINDEFTKATEKGQAKRKTEIDELDSEYKKIQQEADKEIEKLAKIQSDTPSFDPTAARQTANDVRAIVANDLKQRPDMGRKAPWKSMLVAKLQEAGVEVAAAETLADIVWRQHEINNLSRELSSINKAIEKGPISEIVKAIKETPLEEQQNPNWRYEVMRDYLRRAGLNVAQSERIAKLMDISLQKRFTQAKEQAFTDAISKTAPWKAGDVRSKRAFQQVIQALRAGALDPARNVLSDIAALNGWTGFTADQYKNLLKNDAILADTKSGDIQKAEAYKAIQDIISKSKLPIRARDVIGQYYDAQALSGIPTLTVNSFSPIAFAMRNAIVEVGSGTIKGDAKAIGRAATAFVDSIKSWANTVAFSFKNNVTVYSNVDYIVNDDNLLRLYRKGVDQFTNGKNPRQRVDGIKNMMIGMMDYVRRILNALDYGAIASLQNQNISKYAMAVMKNKGMNNKQANEVFAAMMKAKNDFYLQQIAIGTDKNKASILADEFYISSWKKSLEKEGVKVEAIKSAMDAAINDALSSVGRNRQSLDAFKEEATNLKDAGMASSPALWLLESVANAANRSDSQFIKIFSRIIYGFAIVPARVIRETAWFSPYGFVRIMVDAALKNRNIESRYAQSLGSDFQRQQRLNEAIAGTVALFALMALRAGSTDDPEDKDAFKIVFTGNGPQRKDDAQFYDSWYKAGNKPNSMILSFGKTKFTLNMMRGFEAFTWPAMMLGAMDDLEIRKKQNKKTNTATQLEDAAIVAGFVFDAALRRGPYAFTTKSLFGTYGDIGVEGVAKGLTFPAKTLIPVLGTSLASNLSNFLNDPIDRRTLDGAIWSNIPFIGPAVAPKSLNAFGEPSLSTDFASKMFKLGVPIVYDIPTEREAIKLHELVLKQGGGPSIPTRNQLAQRLDRQPTNKEYEMFVKEYGAVLTKAMTARYDRLSNAKPEVYSKIIERIGLDARDIAERKVRRAEKP